MDKNDLKMKLIDLLKQIFRIEEAEDLDFGVYKIMNYKKEEIKKFIDKELIDDVKEQLKLFSEEEKRNIQKKADELKNKIIEELSEDAFENGKLKGEFKNTRLGKKYIEQIKQLEEVKISKDSEIDVYNHIINFFSRYYDKGDFISKRRYGKSEKYVIPYNGEEVLLYWANNDQHYIKTAEQFKKYTFPAKGLTVNFRVTEVEEEIGNIKTQESKFFILSKENIFDFNKHELNIYFDFRELTEEEKHEFGEKIKQGDLNKKYTFEILKKILKKKKDAKAIFEKEKEKTILEKHLNRYTKRNTTDYFIHKNLKEFLKKELDFYIKNEVLNLENLDLIKQEQLSLSLLKSKVLKNISYKLINFLAQLEDFQKKLFEKKKFILKTDYVITLDRLNEYVGEKFLEIILDKVLKNKKQLASWEELFGIKIKNKKNLIHEQTLKGKKWKKLPIDTKYFDEQFKWMLLTSITEKKDLDEVLDGVVIKSDNFQALNTIMNRWQSKIKSIYLDPPYNTGSDQFLYKDKYQHSSWLTFIESRLKLAKPLLRDDGVIFISIANNANYYKESYKLGLVLEKLFNKRFADLIWQRRGASGSYVISDITETHEYVFSWGNENSSIFMNLLSPEKIEEYQNKDEDGLFKWHDLIINQYTKEQRPKLFYGVVYDFTKNKLDFDKDEKKINPSKEVVISPPKHGKSVFTMTKQSMKEVHERGIIAVIKEGNEYKIKIKKYLKDERGMIIGHPLKSILSQNELTYKIGGTQSATKELKNLFGELKFPTAKPTNLIKLLFYISTLENDVVLDFCPGSGTTAHALMKLNKHYGGRRKFILTELEEYFDTIIIPRIKKIAYSFNWEKGKPQGMDGLGIFFKYFYLEQYEDSLENIELKQKTILEYKDYLIKYMLDFETQNNKTFLNIDEMRDPFNYKIRLLNEKEPVIIDLVETFNYFLGLEVKKIKVLNNKKRKYIFVFGEINGSNVLVIWRSIKKIDWKEDKKIIEDINKELNPDEIYINGDAGVKGFKQIESTFKSLLW